MGSRYKNSNLGNYLKTRLNSAFEPFKKSGKASKTRESSTKWSLKAFEFVGFHFASTLSNA